MYSKSIPATTVTTTVLNTATGYTADASLSVPKEIINGQRRDYATAVTMYPKGLEVVNNSGADLEWIMLSNTDDVAMYAAYLLAPTDYPYFSFTMLPKSAVLSNSNLQRCVQFIIRTVTGQTATSGIRIDFNQYGG